MSDYISQSLCKKKTEEFIKQAQLIHGDKYDYSKVNYQNNLQEVTIICREHGEYQQLPKTHKRGNGCTKCGVEERANKKRTTKEGFIEKAKKKYKDYYTYDKVEYTNINDEVIITCPKHGDFKRKALYHLRGGECRECTKNKLSSNTEDFITKAKRIHGNKYIYDKVEYTRAAKTVLITCPNHGDFLQVANCHLSGSGCYKCAGFMVTDTNSFIEEAIKIHGDKYDYSKVDYNLSSIPVTIICKLHGDFLQQPNNHLSGAGCFKCGHDMKIFSTEDFIKEAKKVHGNKFDYSESEYTKMNEKTVIICTKCNNSFQQTPSNHITHGEGCQICAANYKSNTDEFIKKATNIHGDKYDYSKVDYINNHTNVVIICNEHGEFNQLPSCHLQGNGCIHCGIINSTNLQRKNIEDFINHANMVHNFKYDYSNVNYINAHTHIKIICPIHDQFEQTPSSHLNGSGCDLCKNKTEAKLYEALKQIYPTLVTQFKQAWCKNSNTKRYLPFDFCIPEHYIIIELDGRQHFIQVSNWKSPEYQFENDKYKEECANNNNYSTIRILQEDIYYDRYDWISELSRHIEDIIKGDEVVNIYLCKNGEYDLF